jgi:phospholipase C
MKRLRNLLLAGVLALNGSCFDDDAPPTGLNRINHFIVIYLENHSFDNLYGEFPGAEGLSSPGAALHGVQTDETDAPYDFLPQPYNWYSLPPAPDDRFPVDLANGPFAMEDYVAANEDTPDMVHRYLTEQLEINGGKMDRFALVSDASGLSMGYWHTAGLPLAHWAQNYTLCDHFFHAAFGGSFLNHMWLVAAATPVFPNAPASLTTDTFDKTSDPAVTPDGHAVNTVQTVNTPHAAGTAASKLLPNQTMPTIGDRLSDAGVSWAWYSGGWNDALAGHADAKFQFHHQPFAYFASYADGTAAKATHLLDENDLVAALASDDPAALPQVVFYKPIGELNEHPGYADVLSGENHIVDLLIKIVGSRFWADTAVIITYDEHGGSWDHVSPPVGDEWGPGTRVPAMVISPLAKRGFVDHTVYDTTSILATIEHRFGLAPLSSRDANAADLSPAFDF